MKKIFSIPVFAVLMTSLLSFGFKPLPMTAPLDMYVAPAADLEKLPEYKKLLQVDFSSPQADDLKIKYLIARVRQSPYKFIRNGEVHTGVRASLHLVWKYQRKTKLVKNVNDFIREIATGSSLSGEPYLIEVSSGVRYQVKDLLTNELRMLEDRLTLKKAAAASKA